MRQAKEVINFIKEDDGKKKFIESLSSDIEEVMSKIVDAMETTYKDDEDLAKALDLLEEVRDILSGKRM